MKCIKSKEGVIIRVSDIDAAKKVMTGAWFYVPKQEWKALKNQEVSNEVKVEIQETKTKKAIRKKKFKTE
jgi:hypothetical protein